MGRAADHKGGSVSGPSKEVDMFSKKRVMASMAILLVLATALLGCGAANTTTAPATTTSSSITPEEIVANAVSAFQSVNTITMSVNMNVGMAIVGGKQPMTIQVSGDANGSVDLDETQMRMTMDLNVDLPVVGKQQTSTEMYVVDNWAYMKISVPEMADQWLKTQLTPTIWEQQNQVDKQIEMLKNAVKVTSLGEETVNGVDCYVLSIEPDAEALSAFVKSQIPQGLGTDSLQNIDLAQFFNSITMKEWIGKGNYLPAKMDMTMSLDLSPESVGAQQSDFANMTMDMQVQGTYTDYNQPVTVVLPPEAANAKEATTPTTAP